MSEEPTPSPPIDHRALWTLIDERAGATPDALLAVDAEGRRLTFSSYRDACERVAAALYERGVREGHRVAWMLPTGVNAFILTGALSRLAAVQVPLIPILRDREVGFILDQTRATLFVCPTVWRGYDYAAMADRVIGILGHPIDLIAVDTTLAQAEAASLPRFTPSANDPVRWIFYTSGTTANPKGVLHTDHTVAACAHRMNIRFDARPEDRNALVFPVTHIGGIALLMGALMVGYSHILVETFDAELSSALLAREGVTTAGAGPVFWAAYVEAQRRQPERRLFPMLRALLGGGAPKPSTIHDDVRDTLGVALATGYGLTECPTAAHSSVHDPDDILRGDGYALDDTEIRIVGMHDERCADGLEGEIRVRGPMLFKGYLDATLDADAFDDLGFHRTGDLGTLDARGVLTVTGRLKDIIIRKGENISAKEIEDLLHQHPAIADVAVIALPDRDRGELACAVIVARNPQQAPTLSELAEYCVSAGLSLRKVPERVEIMSALPRNPTGKVLKYELRARYAER